MPKNIDKACIIAGNAPSLANIDYTTRGFDKLYFYYF